MIRWLRQHRYALRVAAVRLATRPFSSLANILVLALALAVPFIVWSLLLSTQPLAQQIPIASEITLFLHADTTDNERHALEEQFTHTFSPWIEEFRFISRTQAWDNLKNDPSWAHALTVLDDNPLPDAYILELSTTGQHTQEDRTELLAALEAIPAVEQVLLDIEWLQKLDTLLDFARQVLFFLSVGVMLIVIGTIFNTIRLQALNHQEEIAVARLVGATEDFVRRPFLYFGALIGFLASLLALLMGTLALNLFSDALMRIATSYHINLRLHLPDAPSIILALLVVVMIAALAARWSVSRRSLFRL